jgi:hypothetical protein
LSFKILNSQAKTSLQKVWVVSNGSLFRVFRISLIHSWESHKSLKAHCSNFDIVSCVTHAVEIIGTYQAMETKKLECAIHATKNGWFTKSAHTTFTKPQSFPHTLISINSLHQSEKKRLIENLFFFVH